MDTIEKRYMLDTSALNQLCDNENGFHRVIESLNFGFEYFLTDIQCKEAEATIFPHASKTEPTTVDMDKAKRALKLMEIAAKVRPVFSAQFATLLPGGWPLDGSRDILPDNESAAWEMFLDIRNENPRHHNDAMIAIVNGCTLVANDERLLSKVNTHFPNHGVWYRDFIALIKE